MSQRSGSFVDFRGGDDDKWMSSDGSTDKEMVERALSPMSSRAESQARSVSPTYASQQTIGSSPPQLSPQTNPQALQPDDEMVNDEEVARVLSPESLRAESQLHDVAPRLPQTSLLPQTNSQALRRSQTFPALSTTLQLQSEPAEGPEPAEYIVTR